MEVIYETDNSKVSWEDYSAYLKCNKPDDWNVKLEQVARCVDFLFRVIPRPWDHSRRDAVRREFNQTMECFTGSKFSRVLFLDVFHGLHLSEAGTKAIRSFFRDKVFKAVNGYSIIKEKYIFMLEKEFYVIFVKINNFFCCFLLYDKIGL